MVEANPEQRTRQKLQRVNAENRQLKSQLAYLQAQLQDCEQERLQLQQTQAALQQSEAALQTLNESLESQVHQRTVALAESESRFRRMMATIPGAIYQFSVRGEDWVMDYISDRIQDIVGVSATEIMQDIRRFTERIHPEDLETHISSIMDAIARMVPWQYEGRVVQPSGEVRWWRGESIPACNEQGHISFCGVITDITERKHNEALLAEQTQLLQESEAQNRALLTTMPDMIFCLNAEGVHINFFPSLDWDPAVSPDIFIGKTLAEVLPATVAEQTLTAVQASLQTGHMQVYEYQLEINQVWRDYEARVIAYDRDKAMQIVRDISDRKQAEQQLKESQQHLQQQAKELQQALNQLQKTQSRLIQTEKMSSLAQLVAGIAHEVNNPVNFIHGNITHAHLYIQDLLELASLYQQHFPQVPAAIGDKLDEIDLPFLRNDAQRLFASMVSGTERIRTIVKSLRTFSRLDEAAMKEVDLHESIESVLTMLHSRFKDKTLRVNGVDYYCPEVQIIRQYEDALPLVECYAGQLNQVLMHLLTNAIDAIEDKTATTPEVWGQMCLASGDVVSHPTHPTITLCTTVCTPIAPTEQGDPDKRSPAPHVAISIRDNGSGIPAQVQDKIFDPFFTTKPVGKGTGMGLSVCHQIITESHRGELCCDSTPGHGTTFTLTIPIHQDESLAMR
jgi:PAS domain S-box-containing protein